MKNEIKKTLLCYYGGKYYLAKHIQELAPPSIKEDKNGYNSRYHAFAGGLGELWSWPFEGIGEAVNDLDGELMNFYWCLQNKFEELKRKLIFTPFSDESFRWAIRPGRRSRLDRAVALFIKYRQSRQGLGKSYATPTGRIRRLMNEHVSSWLSAVDYLDEFYERLRRVELRNMDAVRFIKEYDHAKALFYNDPVYLKETRTAKNCYKHEMSDEDHIRLLDCLKDIKGRFILSGYPSPLYDSYGFNKKEILIDNKASSKKKKEKKVEVLWTNY